MLIEALITDRSDAVNTASAKYNDKVLSIAYTKARKSATKKKVKNANRKLSNKKAKLLDPSINYWPAIT